MWRLIRKRGGERVVRASALIVSGAPCKLIIRIVNNIQTVLLYLLVLTG